MILAQDSVTVGILSILTKKILSMFARMFLLRMLVMLIAKFAGIILTPFRLIYAGKTVIISKISKIT